MSPSETRALRDVVRELRKPRNLLRYLRRSGDLTTPLIFAGPTLVLAAYVTAFVLTPGDRVSPEFHATAAQIIPVLLLVLAIEGEVFRWHITRSSLTPGVTEELAGDARFKSYAAGEGPISDALDALLDVAVDAARNMADALLRQATALLLLASMLVAEVAALVPLIEEDPGPGSAKPVMAAIVAGFAGVAYVAITGARFLRPAD